MKELKTLLTLDITKKNVFIIGKPASGKTFISNSLHKTFNTHVVIHTDDYIKKEYQLKDELTNIIKSKHNYILEGNQAYTIIKEIDKSIYPDIIIELIVPDSYVRYIYQKERDMKKYSIALGYYYYHKNEFDEFLHTTKNQIQYYSFNQSFIY